MKKNTQGMKCAVCPPDKGCNDRSLSQAAQRVSHKKQVDHLQTEANSNWKKGIANA